MWLCARNKSPVILELPGIVQHKHVLYQRQENGTERQQQEVVDRLQVRHTGKVKVHVTQHVTNCEHGGDSQAHAGGDGVRVDPEADPRERHDAHARDIHLEDVVHGAALEPERQGQARVSLWKASKTDTAEICIWRTPLKHTFLPCGHLDFEWWLSPVRTCNSSANASTASTSNGSHGEICEARPWELCHSLRLPYAYEPGFTALWRIQG